MSQDGSIGAGARQGIGRGRVRSGFARAGLALATGLAMLAGPGLGQELTVGSATEGEAIYMRHCAACHGIDAEGRGPMAPVLLIQPTDLTRLQAGNGGVFPMIRVVTRIDGRDPLASHGSPMPLFGQLFEPQDTAIKAPDGMPILTSRAIADLVAWMQTIQTTP